MLFHIRLKIFNFPFNFAENLGKVNTFYIEREGHHTNKTKTFKEKPHTVKKVDEVFDLLLSQKTCDATENK